jgi:hypothetical protein
MRPSYEQRIVAFVDMLGISDRLLAEDSERFVRTVQTVTSALTNRRPTVFFALPHVRTGQEIEVQFDKPIASGDRMTTVSDAIVMSFPSTERNNQFALGSRSLPILGCLDAVFWLQRSLLSLGIRTRGGICRGDIFHNRNFVFGEAMLRAYRLESKVAVFPRTVIDEQIIETLLSEPIPDGIAVFRNRIAHMIRIDRDSQHFVDYLGYDPIGGDFRLRDRIADIYRETVSDLGAATDSRLVAKLEWLKDYVWCSMEALADIQTRIGVNAGTKFAAVYPRGEENLMSYVAQMKRDRKSKEGQD